MPDTQLNAMVVVMEFLRNFTRLKSRSPATVYLTNEKNLLTLIGRTSNTPSPHGTAHSQSPSPIYGVIKKISHFEYQIERGEDPTIIPTEAYHFVVMTTGEIRVAPAIFEDSEHAHLASNADTVLFAGKIIFEADGSGTIASWNNASDDYPSEPDLYEQAGLPLDLFIPVTHKYQPK